jgi:hypothetical protein
MEWDGFPLVSPIRVVATNDEYDEKGTNERTTTTRKTRLDADFGTWR